MPLYSYTCKLCRKTFDSFSTVLKRNELQKCKCGSIASRNVEAELNNRGNAVNATMKENIRYSWSLGIDLDNPKAVAAAKKRHPGAEFNKKGQMVIHNRVEKLKRMKERGMMEYG